VSTVLVEKAAAGLEILHEKGPSRILAAMTLQRIFVRMSLQTRGCLQVL
jgi:hypothetical protein